VGTSRNGDREGHFQSGDGKKGDQPPELLADEGDVEAHVMA
jgi:hypothetical protein